MIKKVLVFLYHTSRMTVNLLGIMLLIILVAWSIALLKGTSISGAEISLEPLITQNAAYYWCGTFIAFFIGTMFEAFNFKSDKSEISKIIKWVKAHR